MGQYASTQMAGKCVAILQKAAKSISAEQGIWLKIRNGCASSVEN
jgi:hypothetical protein